MDKGQENIFALGLTPDPDDFRKIYYFHDEFTGSWDSPVLQMLRDVEPGIGSFDFQGMSLEERLTHADDMTAGMRDVVAIGHGMGALVIALLCCRQPDRFRKLILLAPDFQNSAIVQLNQLPADTIVAHGARDVTIPLTAVMAECNRLNLELKVVEDDHTLQGSIGLIKSLVRRVMMTETPDARELVQSIKATIRELEMPMPAYSERLRLSKLMGDLDFLGVACGAPSEFFEILNSGSPFHALEIATKESRMYPKISAVQEAMLSSHYSWFRDAGETFKGKILLAHHLRQMKIV